MKKILLLMLLLGSMGSVATAQSSQEKAVLDRVEMWRKAVVDQDVKTLDQVLSDEMSYGHSSGLLDTKSSFVSTIEDKKEVYNELNLDDMTVSIVGKNAVVRHKMTGKVTQKDGSVGHPNLGVLQVWTKTKSGWQLLARQAFKL